MANKVLVQIEIDVWKGAEPNVRVEEILRETDKCILLFRNVHPRGYYTSSYVENRQVTVLKETLGVRAVGPGRMKALMLLPEQPDVREDPDFKKAMKLMLDSIETELARAGRRLDGLRGWPVKKEGL